MKTVLTTLAFMVVSAPAFAGWKNTQWGMSVQDVLATRSQAFSVTNAQEGVFHGATEVYLVSPFENEFAVQFNFSSDEGTELLYVTVAPANGAHVDCTLLEFTLKATYGGDWFEVIQYTGDPPVLATIDSEHQNMVLFKSFGQGFDRTCHVEYREAPNPEGEGNF